MENRTINQSEPLIEEAFSNCNRWLHDGVGSSIMLLIQSILFDLVGGIISLAYLYRFYQGIEISHPIYSILFSNIIFSTIISIASFVNVITLFTGVSCSVVMNINGISCFAVILLNIISWLSIALTRHYLMTTEQSEIIELNKLTKIAFASTWSVFVITGAIRTVFFFLPNPFSNVFPGRLFIVLPFCILYLVSFCIVSYRTDVVLKERLEIQKEQEESSFKKDTKNDESMNSNQKIDEGSEKYGGIYVGYGGNDSHLPQTESQPNPRPSIATFKDENPRSMKVKNQCRQKISAILNEPHIIIIDHTSEKDTDNGSLPDIPIHNRNEVGLPNQTIMDLNSHENPCRSYETLDGIQRVSNSECRSCIYHSDDTSTSKQAVKSTQNLKVDNEHDPNHIDLLPNSAKNSSIESDFPKFYLEKLENDNKNEIQISKREQLYKESKEHKSIVKAAIFNAICALCIIIIMIFVGILARYPNIYVVIIFNGLVKFQRTFGLLIASVYCFEVVYQLFCEYLDDIRNMIN